MVDLDFNGHEAVIRDARRAAIVCNSSTASMVPGMHTRLRDINPCLDVNILQPTEMACQLKMREYDFYVILTLECPFHPFENSAVLRCGMPLDDRSEMNSIADSFYCTKLARKKGVAENAYLRMDATTNAVVTDSQMFYDYFSYVSPTTCISPKNSVVERDRVRFLISRLAAIDRIKGKQTFGIFFACIGYQALATEVSKFLETMGKDTLVVFLKDISWERLVAIEFIDVIVVIDCPFYTHFDIKIHLPLVTPFEVAQSFKSEWVGEYGVNEFDVTNARAHVYGCSDVPECTDVVLGKETYNLEYSVGDTDMQIHEGLTGCAQNYSKGK